MSCQACGYHLSSMYAYRDGGKVLCGKCFNRRMQSHRALDLEAEKAFDAAKDALEQFYKVRQILKERYQ